MPCIKKALDVFCHSAQGGSSKTGRPSAARHNPPPERGRQGASARNEEKAVKTYLSAVAVMAVLSSAAGLAEAQSVRPAYTADQVAAYSAAGVSLTGVDLIRDCQKYPWPGQAMDAARTWHPVAETMTVVERAVCGAHDVSTQGTRGANGIDK